VPDLDLGRDILVPRQLGTDGSLVADEEKLADAVLTPRGLDRPRYDFTGGEISAHRVNSDSHVYSSTATTMTCRPL
jgi:hypothetical protein